MPPTGYVPKLVVVPAEPGAPLVPYEPPAGSAPVGARPGGLQVGPGDFALLVLGAAMLVFALVAELPLIVLVLASIVTVVGFVLPLRKLLGRRDHRAPRVATSNGSNGHTTPEVLLLDLADPTSMRLAGAYRSLVAAAALRGADPAGAEAVAAGHRALCEAAELLDGRRPANLTELDEVDRRSAAIEQAAASLRASPAPDPPS